MSFSHVHVKALLLQFLPHRQKETIIEVRQRHYFVRLRETNSRR